MFRHSKQFIFILVFAASSSSAFAMGKRPQTPAPVPTPSATPAPTPSATQTPDNSAGDDIFKSIAAGDETPYQLLEKLFSQGRPTLVSDFPTYQDCVENSSHFQALTTLDNNVTTTTKKEALSFSKYAINLVLKDVKIAKGEAQAAVDNGPLFPVSPPIPEVDTVLPYVLSYISGYIGQTCQSSVPIGADMMKTLILTHYTFTDSSEGAKEFFHGDKVDETHLYHSIDGVIVEKIIDLTTDAAGVVTTEVDYNYLWRTNNQ